MIICFVVLLNLAASQESESSPLSADDKPLDLAYPRLDQDGVISLEQFCDSCKSCSPEEICEGCDQFCVTTLLTTKEVAFLKDISTSTLALAVIPAALGVLELMKAAISAKTFNTKNKEIKTKVNGEKKSRSVSKKNNGNKEQKENKYEVEAEEQKENVNKEEGKEKKEKKEEEKKEEEKKKEKKDAKQEIEVEIRIATIFLDEIPHGQVVDSKLPDKPIESDPISRAIRKLQM